jgi:SpoVK/Ycf46/Vps4 family AAA+-type ATPase
MAALVREAGLSVVRELMSKGRAKGSSSGSLAGVIAAHPGDDGSAPSSSSGGDVSGSRVADGDSGSGAGAAESDASEAVCISARHFESALGRVRPSVALHDRQRYVTRTLSSLYLI